MHCSVCWLAVYARLYGSVQNKGFIRVCSSSRPETPAERAHAVFTLLGLRHLCVVDEDSHVRGIITRRDLDAAAGHGAWRRNKIAPGPETPSPSGEAVF